MLCRVTSVLTVARNFYIPFKYYSGVPHGRLTGKIAVVTAATQGIGFATARRLAQEGAKVLFCSRKQVNVENALTQLHSEGLDVQGLVCHVSNQEQRKNLLYEAEQLGGIDILISAAGVNPTPGPFIECTESAWDKIFDTNLKASFFLAKECLPLIKKRQGGSIIFMSTVAAYQPEMDIGPYGVSKTAVLALTKSLANELAQYNIRVNCVAPGYIHTKFVQIMLQDYEKAISGIPMKRVGSPEEVAPVISFLVSQDAAYVTGETIVISGGYGSRL